MLTTEVFESNTEPGEWRVEAIDRDGEGECYVTIFSGPQAEARAKSYAASAIDVEAIKRDAVREFAKKLLSLQRNVLVGTEYFRVVLVSGISVACTARGVNLDEKP